VEVAGAGRLDLLRLAEEVCRRYHREFPDELESDGGAARAWCAHDLQHLLSWAAGEVNGYFEMRPQVAWLAKVLEARRFPLDRLARGLDLGAEVVRSEVSDPAGGRLASVLADAAAHVRSQPTFLD
jgi:hypothetical protein